MQLRRWVLAVLCAVSASGLWAGCGAGTEDPADATRAAESSPTATPEAAASASSTPGAGPRRPSAEEVVQHPSADLQDASVVRLADGFAVATAWRRPDRPARVALVTSDDGFRTRQHTPLRWRDHEQWFGHPVVPPNDRVDLPGVRDLLQSVADSTRSDLRAVYAGGDGATLFPFEEVLRSRDAGRTWERFVAPEFDGARAYVEGAVILPDGRLAVLLQHFSDDTRRGPAPRHHGLWVSEGDDWSRYAPLRPAFDPEVAPATGTYPSVASRPLRTIGGSAKGDGVVWVTSDPGDRLYVSTDGAASFREIPAR